MENTKYCKWCRKDVDLSLWGKYKVCEICRGKVRKGHACNCEPTREEPEPKREEPEPKRDEPKPNVEPTIEEPEPTRVLL
jgi:hypothetical protein